MDPMHDKQMCFGSADGALEHMPHDTWSIVDIDSANGWTHSSAWLNWTMENGPLALCMVLWLHKSDGQEGKLTCCSAIMHDGAAQKAETLLLDHAQRHSPFFLPACKQCSMCTDDSRSAVWSDTLWSLAFQAGVAAASCMQPCVHHVAATPAWKATCHPIPSSLRPATVTIHNNTSM